MSVRKWGNEAIVADASAHIFLSGDMGLDVTTLSDGSYIVSWIQQDGFIIEAQRFSAAGQPIGDVFEIGASVTGSSKTDVTLTATDDGGFAASFTNSANAGDSWYEQFDANGNVVRTTQWDQSSTALVENTGSVASKGNYIYLAETDAFGDGDVYLQMRNTTTGTAATINNSSTYFKLNSDLTAGSQHSVNIALSGTSLAAAWIDGQTNTFRLRIFTVDTTTVQPTVTGVTASLDVAGAVGGIDFGPQVVAMANGGFVVVWHDDSGNDTPDKSNYSVHAKMYAADGTALSSEITVNALFNSLQARPDVLALRNGGFLVTWDDNATGARNISGQMFDAFGNRVGGQFTVPTHTTGTNYDARLTELDDGRIVVVWANQTDGMIRQQIIDPRDGVVDGTTTGDTLYGHDALGDVINGMAGDDVINGLSGNDQVYGGEGSDTANGGKGDDVIFGGEGDDDLRGGSGEDTLNGEDGSDDLTGNTGDDELAGGAGDDSLTGNQGADSLRGGSGSDMANYADAAAAVTVALDGSLAGTGDAYGDTFSSVENLTGSAFGDSLVGSTAANSIKGGEGNDRITGGRAADTLRGGSGNDAFVYTALNEAGDNVLDFSSTGAGNNDRLEFEGDAFGGLTAGVITASMFQSSAAASAQTAAARFLFETDTGVLRFDADGQGGADAIIVATLQAGATMSFNDILIL
jgi:Ca2+-binding RTX toxin-like protein